MGSGDGVEDAVCHYLNMLRENEDLAGVVIDVRSNPGGMNADNYYVFGQMMPEDHVVFYMRQKNGPNRLDFGPWLPEYIPRFETSRTYDIPIVVLADMNSVSNAEFSTMIVRSLPTGVFIGERTWGGTGSLLPENKYFQTTYSGYVKNDWYQLYTTNCCTKDVFGVVHEGVGVSPDIEEPFDEAAWMNGVDNQLERAVSYIRNGR